MNKIDAAMLASMAGAVGWPNMASVKRKERIIPEHIQAINKKMELAKAEDDLRRMNKAKARKEAR